MPTFFWTVAVLADSFRQEKLLINLLDKATFPQPYAEGNCLVVICRRVYKYDFFFNYTRKSSSRWYGVFKKNSLWYLMIYKMQAFAKTLWKTRKFSIQEFGFPTYIVFLHLWYKSCRESVIHKTVVMRSEGPLH